MGDVSIGPMGVIRGARFNFGIGDLHQVGFSISAPRYLIRLVRESGGLVSPKSTANSRNLSGGGLWPVPWQSRNSLAGIHGTYDRWPLLQDSKLLDLITAFEALLGTESEIAFKLAFRIAALLADSDGSERNCSKQ